MATYYCRLMAADGAVGNIIEFIAVDDDDAHAHAMLLCAEQPASVRHGAEIWCGDRLVKIIMRI